VLVDTAALIAEDTARRLTGGVVIWGRRWWLVYRHWLSTLAVDSVVRALAEFPGLSRLAVGEGAAEPDGGGRAGRTGESSPAHLGLAATIGATS
jgi:hypothetical protein